MQVIKSVKLQMHSLCLKDEVKTPLAFALKVLINIDIVDIQINIFL